MEEILREADKKITRQMRNKKGKDSIDRVIKKMCTEAGIKEEELRSGGKRREVTKVRGRLPII